MTKDLHERARGLIAATRVEGIPASDQGWLDAHLEGCLACAEQAKATERAIRTLRSSSVRVDPELLHRTRQRVHLRSDELRPQQAQWLPLWILCCLSWACIVASTSYLWRGFQWVGHWVGVPDLMWQIGFALWWVLPAVLALAILSKSRTHVVD